MDNDDLASIPSCATSVTAQPQMDAQQRTPRRSLKMQTLRPGPLRRGDANAAASDTRPRSPTPDSQPMGGSVGSGLAGSARRPHRQGAPGLLPAQGLRGSYRSPVPWLVTALLLRLRPLAPRTALRPGRPASAAAESGPGSDTDDDRSRVSQRPRVDDQVRSGDEKAPASGAASEAAEQMDAGAQQDTAGSVNQGDQQRMAVDAGNMEQLNELRQRSSSAAPAPR